MYALDIALNEFALQGAKGNFDPSLPPTLGGGTKDAGGGSNWATGFTDSMAAYFFWMWADGFGGSNVDCNSPKDPGCWDHRDATLSPFTNDNFDTFLMGAAFSPPSSYADVFEAVRSIKQTDYELTWSAAQQMGFGSSPAPVVASLSGTSVPTGSTLTVSGYNLAGGTVSFGSTPASGTCGATSCTVTVPALPGVVDVTVTTAHGTSVAWTADHLSSTGGTERIAGAERVATSIATSQNAFPKPGSASAVLVASDANFADALSAVPLAARLQGPIILTPPDALDGQILPEIDRVLAPGATITVLGGTLAVSDAVAHALQQTNHPVVRLGGPTRFATAILIAQELSDPPTVFEVDGDNPADSVAAGPAAVAQGAAILLTDSSHQHADSASYLAAHPGDTRIAVGGPAAAADPGATKKIVGADRYETAAMVAQAFFPAAAVVGIAATTADALTGGVALALVSGPMLLVNYG
jgi:putative cell wall-binding protein